MNTLSKMLMGLFTAAIVLLSLEVLLGATRGIWDESSGAPAFRVLRNNSDPEAIAIDLGADAEVLGESMLFHIVSDELTRPDSEYLFRVKPNPTGEPIHGYKGINAQGFRGRSIDADEAVEHRSVVVLGDSCGFGWGIKKFEATWAEILERSLQSRDPTFRVYNLSQPGYSTAQARALYETWAPRLEPDVLVIYLGWNDLWPTGRWNDTEAMARVRWTNGPLVQRLQRSQLYQFLAIIIGSEGNEPQRGDSDPLYRPRVPHAQSVENLHAIIEDARGRNTRVFLIPPPSVEEPIELAGIDRIGEFNRLLVENIVAGVERVELPEMRHGAPDLERLFIKDGYHPNRAGAAYIAEALLIQIMGEG